MRYNTLDDNGETRADRNDRFGFEEQTQYPDIPEHFYYIWEWFWEIIDTGRHVFEGSPTSFTHEELRAWVENLGAIVRREEMLILISMSQAWRDAMTEELEAQRAARESKTE